MLGSALGSNRGGRKPPGVSRRVGARNRVGEHSRRSFRRCSTRLHRFRGDASLLLGQIICAQQPLSTFFLEIEGLPLMRLVLTCGAPSQ